MRTTYTLLLACVIGVTLGAWLMSAWRRVRERRRARAYNVRGQRAERDAEQLLEAHGYAIVERQLRTTYAVAVGDATQEIRLVLDFVVERGGVRCAAEVKSGVSAPRLEHAETRRQLLEYQLALRSDRVLLVDPERARIHEVAFPIPRPAERRRSNLPLVAAATLGLLLLAASGWFLTR